MQSAPLSRKRSERALPADLQPRIRTSPRRSNFVALCVCSLISLAALSAFADPTPEDVATAKALVRTARELRAAGDHPAALDKYRAAYALVPTPITGIELAEELASNGLLVDGREMFLTVAKMPAKDGEKREYTEARAKAAERANELGPRIPTLIVRVHPSVVAGDVHVSIDGREIPAAALGLPRKVNPDGRDRKFGRGGRLERAPGATYEHDKNGNVSAKVEPDGVRWAYAWNGHGMLREVKRPDGTRVVFEYDAFARRTKKKLLGSGGDVMRETRFVWDGNCVVHEMDSDEGQTNWHWVPESFTPVMKEREGRKWSVVSDHLGTPTEMYDEAGTLAWKMQSDVWGVAEYSVGRKEDCAWRWPGQYEDEETGWLYNRFRYFDPQTSSYASLDPIRLAGGFSLYGYVRAPSTELDPLGLADCKNEFGIPGNRTGAFARWFDAQPQHVIDELWQNPAARRMLEDRIRHPGGMHEWLLAGRAPTFKRWGVSMSSIHELRTPTRATSFVDSATGIIGGHGLEGSGGAHSELINIIDQSNSYGQFKQNLQNWSNYRLPGGVSDLPAGLRPGGM
jgi:RHS repeat-associated protein